MSYYFKNSPYMYTAASCAGYRSVSLKDRLEEAGLENLIPSSSPY